MIIRAERYDDFRSISEVNRRAFQQDDEGKIVERIRASEHFVLGLSLVAEKNGRIVGHILLSKTKIVGEEAYDTLLLGPLAVLPEFQRQGIGEKLVVEGLRKARELGFDSVILVGHPEYYPRFGFQKASIWGIKCPFDVPDGACMAIELNDGALAGKSGVIQFPTEFGLE